MNEFVPGLHHITAICGAPQTNVDFYAGTLAQRLVKKTVNFDDPGTYHLYYGDEAGTPGSILTFFPFAGAGPGRAGAGMASAFAYGVPGGALTGWQMKLREAGIIATDPFDRFGEQVMSFADPDGLQVELAETGWANERAMFHSVTLNVADEAPTARVLMELFGYERMGEEVDEFANRRIRYVSPAGGAGAVVDLLVNEKPARGVQGTGTIHHVAFRAETDEVQREWQDRARSMGLDVTPVIDRQYFNAIYFREPGGTLFEIATDPPGFAHDESLDTMGSALMLPDKYEAHRAEIEKVLPPIEMPARP